MDASRFLIIRLSAMGDVIHAIPAVTALRLALPQALIGWMIDPRWAPLLSTRDPQTAGAKDKAHQHQAQPLVDRLHLADMKAWRRSPLSSATRKSICAIRKETKAENYDVAIDLQGAVRSALIGSLSGAKSLVGDCNPREPGSQLLYDQSFPGTGVHVVEQAHEIVCRALGRRLPLPQPMLPRDPEAEAWIQCQLKDLNIKDFVLINPGAGWGAKCWPAIRYGEVARNFAREGLGIIVNVGPNETILGEQVERGSEGAAIPLSCTVAQLISLTRRARLFLGGDTGPMHLAAALGVPVVGIFGPTDPARNGPFGTKSIVLRHAESRRDHSRHSAPEKGLLEITVDEVAEAARRLLDSCPIDNRTTKAAL